MNSSSSCVLLVDDNEADRYMMTKAWKMAEVKAELVFATDGEEAIKVLTAREGNPDEAIGVILMDINMPVKDGLQTVRQIRQSTASFRWLPVLLWSSSSRIEDVNKAYSNGANAYLLKPSSVQEYVAIASSIGAFWCGRVLLPSTESSV